MAVFTRTEVIKWSFSVLYIEKLASEVYALINFLGFAPKIYKIPPPKEPKWDQKIKYQVRLSKDVQKFLDLVKPDKS